MKIVKKIIRISFVVVCFATSLSAVNKSDCENEKCGKASVAFKSMTIAEAYKILEIPFGNSITKKEMDDYKLKSSKNIIIKFSNVGNVCDKKSQQYIYECLNIWNQVLLKEGRCQTNELQKESVEYTYNGYIVCRFSFYGIDDAHVAFIFDGQNNKFLGYVKSGIFKF